MNRKQAFRSVITTAITFSLFALLAACGGGGDSGSAAGESGSITLTTDAPESGILADGSSSATITATVKDSAGNPVHNYTDVNFSTTLGHFRNGSYSYTVQTQPKIIDGKIDPKADPTGIAIVAFISGTTPGTANITVSSNGVTNLVRITLKHAGNTGVPVGEAFSLAAAYLNISGLWVASLEDTITASVGDVYGNTVKDSTLISFKTYNTGGFFGTDTVPTSAGLASSNLYSAGAPTPLQGFVSLTAETTGGATTRVTALEVVPYPDYHIMYAGTNGGGVYKSTDYGATWVTVSRSTQNPRQGQNLIDPYIKGHSAIAVDPDNHNVVYAGTGYLGKGNVFRSLDGAMNWNSNNVEQWNGLYDTTAAVLTVVADGDDNATTDYPYVWIGTEGRGPLYATDGKSFQPSGGIATVPVAGAGNTGNGTMSQAVLSYNSKTETWTATCARSTSSATTPTFSGIGDGGMSPVTISASTKTETWTVQYTASAGAVTGTAVAKGGNVANIKTSTSETIKLTCKDITTVGSEVFSVVGDVSGAFLDATAGVAYDSKTGLTFQITQAAAPTPYIAGDVFTFTTTTSWLVTGTASGPQTNTATTGTAYASDNNEVSFTIWQGATDYVVGDKFTFSTTAGLTYWVVVGTVSGTQDKLAFASQGYYSDGQEVYFVITEGTTPFAVGDIFSFAVTANILNHGWTVWDMVRVPDTHGATAILYTGTAAGVYKTTNGAQTWSSLGLFTGDYIIALELYPTATGGATDIIYAGTQNGGVWVSTNSGSTWTQYAAGMDSGMGATIKDILVDPVNHRLYAIAYTGPTDQATGDVYFHTLNSDGTMTSSPWTKANSGLSGKALFALAANIPSSPTALFAGGEGINFHIATNGLDTGSPSWQRSKTGLSNTIMARMPILFSGECFMTVYRTDYGNGFSYFEVYIEDINGNPPLQGSAFKAEATPRTGVTPAPPYWDIKSYPDCYTTPHGSLIHGTFSDPSNGATNDPYWVTANGNLYESVTFTFTPECKVEPPGCSGMPRTLIYTLSAP